MAKLFLALLILQVTTIAFAQDGAQQFADLGSCRLENGQSIVNCRIGYRTYGKLNADRSNAVVVTTWFLGTSKGVASASVGPKNYFDPARFFVIVIDALGDGVSSSPSNSKEQPRMRFPIFTIRDMVETQHRLVTEKFGLTHVRAVEGASMGGMQALQWAFSYPDFMDRVVAIVPTPRQTSYDLLLWRSVRNAIESDVEWRGGDYTGTPIMKAATDICKLHLQTPTKIARDVPASNYPHFAEADEESSRSDPNDEIRDLQAMMSQDVAPGRTIIEMAKMLKPKTMIVVGKQDMMVNPGPATELARAAQLRFIELDSDCGHLSPSCESDKVNPAIRDFVEK